MVVYVGVFVALHPSLEREEAALLELPHLLTLPTAFAIDDFEYPLFITLLPLIR